jgi:hypothetical protein
MAFKKLNSKQIEVCPDLLFLLDNSLAKLRGCGWPGLSPVEPPLKLIPQMFNGIKIRTLGRPGYDSDVVLLEIVLGDPCSVRGGVILLENEVSMPRKKGRYMGDQHLLDIASWTNILEDYRSNKHARSHPAPDHHSWASPWVPLDHTCVVERSPRRRHTLMRPSV